MSPRSRAASLLADARLLGLSDLENVTLADIKQARDALMQKHHPDRGGSTERAQRINKAHARLCDWVQNREVRDRRIAKSLNFAMGVAVMVASGSIVALRRLISKGRGS